MTAIQFSPYKNVLEKTFSRIFYTFYRPYRILIYFPFIFFFFLQTTPDPWAKGGNLCPRSATSDATRHPDGANDTRIFGKAFIIYVFFFFFTDFWGEIVRTDRVCVLVVGEREGGNLSRIRMSLDGSLTFKNVKIECTSL